MKTSINDLANKKVMYVETNRIPDGISKTFEELESKLPSLKQRRFFGVMFRDKYWAAVEIIAQDDPTSLGLELAEIPGGKYACTKLKKWDQNSLSVDIPRIFKELTRGFNIDNTRPFIEFYRSQQELVLQAPIAK